MHQRPPAAAAATRSGCKAAEISTSSFEEGIGKQFKTQRHFIRNAIWASVKPFTAAGNQVTIFSEELVGHLNSMPTDRVFFGVTDTPKLAVVLSWCRAGIHTINFEIAAIKRKLLSCDCAPSSVVAVVAWFFRPKHETLGEAYVSERSTTLWSSVAQVREPLDSTLHYGIPCPMSSPAAMTASYAHLAAGELAGPISRYLMRIPRVWQRAAQNCSSRTKPTPMQARTKLLSPPIFVSVVVTAQASLSIRAVASCLKSSGAVADWA